MIQFSLVSLIPGLINNLGDCADPAFDNYVQNVKKPTSLRTSERSSCMLNHNCSTSTPADFPSARIHGLASANIWKGWTAIG